MKLVDARTVSAELDGGLVALEGLALTHGPARDLTPEQAQAVLAELQRLWAMEQRARAVLRRPGLAEAGTPVSASLYILGECDR